MIAGIIAADPTNIVITRHVKSALAGGYEWIENVLAAQTVRLYHFTTRNQREITLPEGEVKSIVLGILAETDVSMEFGHNSYDTFPHGGTTYRIVGVRDYDDANIPNCLQADCVAV